MPISASSQSSHIGSPLNRPVRFRFPWLFLLFSLGLCLLLFHGFLFGTDQFTYRDEANFYHPLYRYVQEELSAGRFPLWTPYSNIGMPFFANAALGILYPGKIIFFLPFDYSLLFNWFLVGHVFLASLTFYHLARSWRLAPISATFGALAYAFSGAVLGQYVNPIFLIGAAWVPEAVLWGDRSLARRSIGSAVVCATVLALMMLGGDPQAAFHVGLILTLLALLRILRDRSLQKLFKNNSCDRRTTFLFPLGKFHRNRLVLLTVIAGTTFLLTAIQVLPSSELGRLSDRARAEGPRSLWEIPSYLQSLKTNIQNGGEQAENPFEIIADTLFHHTREMTNHHKMTYSFSTHPVQLFSFLWPEFGGRYFQENTSWLHLFGRFLSLSSWVFTCYFGIIPFLLALLSLRFRTTNNTGIRQVWLSYVAIIAVLGSLGCYGFGWFLDQFFGFSYERSHIGPPIGGVYWLLQIFVPGYIQFRFPAKLLTLAMLPLAMLAALGLQRLMDSMNKTSEHTIGVRFLRPLAIAIIVISLFLLIPTANEREWFAMASKMEADIFSGPFQHLQARAAMLFSLFQTSLVLFLFLILIRLSKKITASVAFGLILLVTVVDLYLACAPTIYVTDRSHFEKRESILLRTLQGFEQDTSARDRLFIHSNFDGSIPYPKNWKERTDPFCLQNVLILDRNYLFHRFYYDQPRTVAGNLPLKVIYEAGTFLPASYVQWIDKNFDNDWGLEKMAESLAVDYVLIDVNKRLDPNHAIPIIETQSGTAPPDWNPDYTLWKIVRPKGRVRIERENSSEIFTGDSCRIELDEPGRVVIWANLNAPGTLVLADQYWPGWKVLVEEFSEPDSTEVLASSDGIIHPVEDLFRGVELPAGSFRLTFCYDPDSFRYGAIVSAIAWLGLLPIVLIMYYNWTFAKCVLTAEIRAPNSHETA